MTYPSRHLMRISEVTKWLGVSRSWVYKHVKDGTFPEPIILGQDDGKRSASRWDREKIQEWLDECPRGVQTDAK